MLFNAGSKLLVVDAESGKILDEKTIPLSENPMTSLMRAEIQKKHQIRVEALTSTKNGREVKDGEKYWVGEYDVATVLREGEKSIRIKLSDELYAQWKNNPMVKSSMDYFKSVDIPLDPENFETVSNLLEKAVDYHSLLPPPDEKPWDRRKRRQGKI